MCEENFYKNFDTSELKNSFKQIDLVKKDKTYFKKSVLDKNTEKIVETIFLGK